MNNDAPKTIAVGHTVDTGTVRIHRYADSFEVTDITNAGRRGKTCRVASICRGYGANRPATLDGYALALAGCASYDAVMALVADVAIDFPGSVRVTESSLRGVRVLPTATPVVIDGAYVRVVATPLDATVSCLMDGHNQPRGYPTSRTASAVFYGWVQANRDRAATMTFRQIMSEMLTLRIGFHDYLAID